ncbi:hypothetical protein [Pseudogemmobacter bohemicus]|uniref:hypothetical protein n=1 Tax=Pseudogemmobacter bohemicus TaxID=2250708 RepID=UPI0013007E11|nr:hypothetical protein [Pseudogemmobacter bohemicus]
MENSISRLLAFILTIWQKIPENIKDALRGASVLLGAITVFSFGYYFQIPRSLRGLLSVGSMSDVFFHAAISIATIAIVFRISFASLTFIGTCSPAKYIFGNETVSRVLASIISLISFLVFFMGLDSLAYIFLVLSVFLLALVFYHENRGEGVSRKPIAALTFGFATLLIFFAGSQRYYYISSQTSVISLGEKYIIGGIVASTPDGFIIVPSLVNQFHDGARETLEKLTHRNIAVYKRPCFPRRGDPETKRMHENRIDGCNGVFEPGAMYPELVFYIAKSKVHSISQDTVGALDKFPCGPKSMPWALSKETKDWCERYWPES